eukprot:Nk52_evm86s230 gene=Nk52_evmTU86s230
MCLLAVCTSKSIQGVAGAEKLIDAAFADSSHTNLNGVSGDEKGMPSKNGSSDDKVIYGTDNRIEPYMLDGSPAHVATKKIVDSEVILTTGNKLTYNAMSKSYSISTVFRSRWTTRGGYPLCPNEPFYGQINIGFCSGFLVGQQMIATAGHCIRNQFRCDNTYFIFGFSQRSGNIDPELDFIPEDRVYKCANLHAQLKKTPYDFALVNLDRPVVSSRIPLTLNHDNTLATSQPLVVVGHPVGLPTKVAGGAEVKFTSIWGRFDANLDTYSGNSGSVVVNTNTWKVEGILVSGQTDFELNSAESCMESNRCSDSGCFSGYGFESVSTVNQFEQYIPGYKGLIVSTASKMVYILEDGSKNPVYDKAHVEVRNTGDSSIAFTAKLTSSLFTSASLAPITFDANGDVSYSTSIPAGSSMSLPLNRVSSNNWPINTKVELEILDTTNGGPYPHYERRWTEFQSSPYSRICSNGDYSSNNGASPSRFDVLDCSADTSATVMNAYVFTAGQTGTISIDTCTRSPNVNTLIRISELNCDYTFGKVVSCSRSSCGVEDRIKDFIATKGKTYVITAGNSDSFSSESFELTVTASFTFDCDATVNKCPQDTATTTTTTTTPEPTTTTTTTTTPEPTTTTTTTTTPEPTTTTTTRTTAAPSTTIEPSIGGATSSYVASPTTTSPTTTSAPQPTSEAELNQGTCDVLWQVTFKLPKEQGDLIPLIETVFLDKIHMEVAALEKADNVYLFGEEVEWFRRELKYTNKMVKLRVKVRGEFSKNRKFCKHRYLNGIKDDMQNELEWLVQDLKDGENAFSYIKDGYSQVSRRSLSQTPSMQDRMRKRRIISKRG